MHPVLHIPTQLLGAVLIVVGALWAWRWRTPARAASSGADPSAAPEDRQMWLFGLVLVGVGLCAVVLWRTIAWPTYGFMMLLGCLAVMVFTIRWTSQRKLLSMEHAVELLVLSGVCGLIGARAVFLVEQWDTYFAHRPPVLRTGNLSDARLAPGDALRLRVHGAREVTVTFAGGEADLEAVRDEVLAQAGAADVRARVLATQHRGPDGLARTERGLLLETGRRGPEASLEVLGGQAAVKLGPIVGMSRGVAVPWTRMFDLRMGGLTYFGSVFGVLLSAFVYLRLRRVPVLRLLDAVAPALPLGLFFGRLGCLSRGCCFGREVAGGGAGLEYPAWSLPWRYMVDEHLGCNADLLLAQGAELAARGEALPSALERLLAGLGPLAERTPPLHASQLYEGLACLAIVFLVWAYRERLQTRVGQAFALLVLLQAPVRFVVEHTRRDHDVFWAPTGYLLTESQTVAILLFAGAVAALVTLHRRGEPIQPDVGAFAAPPPAATPTATPAADATTPAAEGAA